MNFNKLFQFFKKNSMNMLGQLKCMRTFITKTKNDNDMVQEK